MAQPRSLKNRSLIILSNLFVDSRTGIFYEFGVSLGIFGIVKFSWFSVLISFGVRSKSVGGKTWSNFVTVELNLSFFPGICLLADKSVCEAQLRSSFYPFLSFALAISFGKRSRKLLPIPFWPKAVAKTGNRKSLSVFAGNVVIEFRNIFLR